MINLVFLASLFYYKQSSKEVPLTDREISLFRSPLVHAALGSVFSVLPYLPYLFEKNSLNSDTACHMVNHVGVNLILLMFPVPPLFLKALLGWRAYKKQPTSPNSEGLHEED